jgi:hypothetical protein
MVSMWVSWRRDGLETMDLAGRMGLVVRSAGEGLAVRTSRGDLPDDPTRQLCALPDEFAAVLADKDNLASPDRGVPRALFLYAAEDGRVSARRPAEERGGPARRFAVPRRRPAINHGSQKRGALPPGR